MSQTKFGLFFTHLKEKWQELWTKEPAIENTIVDVIAGINHASATLNTPEADIIAKIFPNGAGGKTLEEVKAIIPEALQVSQIASDALKGSEGMTEPQRTNNVIQITLTEIAKLPQLQQDAKMLAIVSAIVSKLLGISQTEATAAVATKQLEIQGIADHAAQPTT